ncbi:hypothetical protein ACGFX4_17675 [Kitasatospora sp. NPDC048365]|uniref:hypothetical protein n=1 Tax=Kitasatospora sp. NPDC048365 TaxID=3364050 RepID=UPI0037224DE0
MPPRYADEDEQVQVIGVHRGGRRRQISLIIFRRHLENFRVKGVHSPAVQRVRADGWYWGWNRVWCCPELAQPWVDRWNALAAGLPAPDFPPWPARSTVAPDAGPCPHLPPARPGPA